MIGAKLAEAIALAVRFLDNVVEVNNYPLPFIETATRNNRRIGLGIMGWAETLIMLGIAYDSEEAVIKAEETMAFINKEAKESSRQLAEVRGCFPNWQFSTWADTGMSLRNATVTTIAPTGTISIIAGTSSGIEPLFAISFVRRVMAGAELVEVNPLFERVAKERGFYSPELMERIAREGTLSHIDGIPADVKRVWVCSHDISYEWHVRMQVAFQKHTDNAVSKTINLPHNAAVEDVRGAYLAAWNSGLKGITVYRDASRASQVLNIRKTDAMKNDTKYGDQYISSSSPPARTFGGSDNSAGEHFNPGNLSNQIDSNHKNSNQNYWHSSGIGTITLMAPLANATNVYKISDRRCAECGSASAFEARYEACIMCRVCGYTKC